MPIALLALILLSLTGCGQDLHFKIQYADIGSLAVGDALILDDKPIGTVINIEALQPGSHLVEVAIPRVAAAAATSEANFILSTDPADSQRRRIEIVLSNPGGKRIADDAVVEGSYPHDLPFAEMLNGFSDGLHDLRRRVGQLQQQLQQLPNTPEAEQLQQEWRNLTDAISRAQHETGEIIQQEIMPKLEQEMDGLRRRLEAMQRPGRKQGKPLEA